MKNKVLHIIPIFILVLLLSLNVQAQNFPFPQNRVYGFGLMPGNRSGADAQSAYNTWKTNFLASCANGRYRVKFDDPNQTVSEGIGYGMLLSAYAGDRAIFDGLWNYYKDNRNSHGVMNWKIGGCSGTVGANGATDAEIDAAMALIVAHYQWGSTSGINYDADAKALIGAIKSFEIESGSNVMKPGDFFGGSNITNPSYFAPGYFRVYASFTGDAFWNAVADKCHDVINKNLSVNGAAGGLVSDWCKADGGYSPDAGGYNQGGRLYLYDAARTPWRIAVDYVWHGNTSAKTYSKKSSDFVRINLGGPQNVKDGYNQNGSAYGQWHNSTFAGAFACAAMGGDVQAHLDNSYADLRGINDNNSYFNHTLKTLYMFLLTGNFYKPGPGGSTPPPPPPPVAQSPYGGTATAIPGRVEAERYDNGGSTVAYSDATAGNSGTAFRADDVDVEATTDAGGGYNVGWTAAGEWLEYTVNVAAAGKYDFKFRIATTATGKSLHVEMNGTNVTGVVALPNTAGWQIWQTVTVAGVNLSAGSNQVMRVYMETDGFNFNYIDVTAVSTPPPPANQAPAVAITSPANGASFTAPASVTINASASDADGTISKVEFFNGSTKLGEDLSAPYSFTWNNVAAGTYTLTAKATDNATAVSTSAGVSVTVNGTTPPPPTNCPVNAVPPAAQWSLRNDWSDQNNGSAVLNTTDALQVRHRQWGRNYLWATESGKTMTLTAGKAYTIKFDFKNDASNPVSSVDVGFASSLSWDGAILAQPAVNVTGFSSSAFTTKTVTINATVNATVYLVFKLNWPGQPNLQVNTYLKNVSACTPTGAKMSAVVNTANTNGASSYGAMPNPFEGQTVITVTEELTVPMKLQIIDVSGKVVYQSADHFTNEEILMGETLTGGIYFVQAIYEGKAVTFKLIKN
ncbi:MAG: carbohydrate-binding protein [Cytophagaceae bacterium]|nr:carbohydrate-binding protein [Cytophagaceae bacterium]